MYKKLPYGLSDFKRVKVQNYYYIDKTKFIETVEDSDSFLFFLRPRRFGKSLTIAMLEAYYDVYYESQFDEIFKDTYILNNHTEFKSSFYILRFDFSAIDITDYEQSFRNNIDSEIINFVRKYKIEFSIDKTLSPIDNIKRLLSFCSSNNMPLYILIDEYDNFVNKLLVSDINSYKDMVTDTGAFYKEFFTMLKVGTSGNDSAIQRMFFTGVSPLALFDVTSGSNIGKNVSLESSFNDMVGVTKQELKEMIKHYDLQGKQDKIIARCDEWYNNYRFHKDVKETIYNSDMILYYLDSIIRENSEPDDLIDVNVRTDYTKLKYLVYTNNRLNGNFNLLNELIQDRPVHITNIKTNFSAFEMLQRENFSSFLFALGFLTIEKDGFKIKLSIPNQTIKKIVAEFIESAYKSIEFNVKLDSFNEKLSNFASDKNLEVFHYLNQQAEEQSCIRDYIDGENFIKGFLVAYLSLNPYYEVRTEQESNKGFIDIVLNPIMSEIPYGAIIELKYIPISKYTEKLRDEKVKEATAQLNRYEVKDLKGIRDREFIKIVLVYRGWEMVVCESV